MIGGPLGGWIIDICGRKIALMTTAVPFGTGWLMIGLGKSAAMLHAGRFFSGLGVGMASLITPVRATSDSSPYTVNWTSCINYYLILTNFRAYLRAVPTFVTTYTFCASQDTQVSNG